MHLLYHNNSQSNFFILKLVFLFWCALQETVIVLVSRRWRLWQGGTELAGEDLNIHVHKVILYIHRHHWGHIFHYTNQEVSLLLTKDFNCIQRNWAEWTIWIQLVFNCITTNAKSKQACVPATIFCQFTVTYLSRSSRVCSWYSPRAWSSSWQRFPTVHSEAKKSRWAPPWQPTNEAQLGAK